MAFSTIAKNLLKESPHTIQMREEGNGSNALSGRARTLYELALNGFAPDDICRELRSLYDETEEVSEKKQILELVIKVQGMLQETKEKEIPQIVFNILGRPDRIDEMLCPTSVASG